MTSSFGAQLINNLRRHQFLLASIGFVSMLLFILGQLMQFQATLIERTTIAQASQYAIAVRESRNIYSTLVADMTAEQQVEFSHTYLTEPGVLPPPMTVSILLGEQLAGEDSGSRIHIVSENAAKTGVGQLPSNQFEIDALTALRQQPNEPYYQFTETDGVRAIRYAVPEVMQENCVACHQALNLGLKTDWQEGDVYGALIIELPTEAAWQQGQIHLIRISLTIVSMVALVGLMQLWAVRRNRSMREGLEQRVFERTAALTAVNHQLEKGIGERESAEKRLSAVLDTVGEGIVTIDSELNIVMVNRAANTIWGYNPGELIGAPLTQLMLGEMKLLNELISFIRHSEKDSSGDKLFEHRLETVGIRKDESHFPVEVGIARTDIDDQKLYTIAARDFTRRKQIEDALREERTMLAHHVEARTVELRRANEELAHASKLKDEFLASMSHELRTPLNAILGLSEALQTEIYGSLDERMERPLSLINDSGLHLLDLINDILDVSKIEAGQVKLDKTDVAISIVCQASMEMVRQVAEKKSIRLRHQIAPDIHWMQADERRLKQILVNLLSNAVKFTPDGGAVGLQVRASEDRSELQFVVVDTGIGIPEDEFGRLFDPFVQVDSSLSRRFNGTGLGLALVSRLTELHGGNVALDSKLGRGSRFTVTIPWVQRDDQLVIDVAPEKPRPVYSPPESTTPPTVILEGYRPRILLAEDNEVNVATIFDFLEFQGYRVTVASDGLEAVEMSHNKPDIILMDIQMPRMDGLEAMRQIRTNAETADIPIIALTGLAMAGDRERCLAAGADDYLSKPFQLEALMTKLAVQLAHLKTLEIEPA